MAFKILNSEDLFHQINQRRNEVEPYLPLKSEGLAAFYPPSDEPKVIEFISSQAAYRPSPQHESEYARAMETLSPSTVAYVDYVKQSRQDTQLQEAVNTLHGVKLGDLVLKVIGEKEATTFVKEVQQEIVKYSKERRAVFATAKKLLVDAKLLDPGEKNIDEDRVIEVAHQMVTAAFKKGGRPDLKLIQTRAQFEKFYEDKDTLTEKLVKHYYPDEFARAESFYRKSDGLKQTAMTEVQRPLGYTPPELTAEVSRHLHDTLGISKVEDGHLNLFNGGSFVTLMMGIGSVMKPGQYLVTPEMHWDGYNALPEQFGGKLLDAPRGENLEAFLRRKLVDPQDGRPPEEQIHEKAGCLLLTHPCSITGKRQSDEELDAYLGIVKKYRIPLVVNEVYGGPDEQGKPYNSITGRPGFDEVGNMVYISSSLTKTFQQLNAGYPKLAFSWTKSKKWADSVKQALEHQGHPFSAEEVALDLGMLKGTPKEYFVRSEQESEARRRLMEAIMQDENRRAGKELLGWSVEGHPGAGYTAAVQLNAESAAKAGIKTPLDLWEYVYKVSGVNAGPVFFSEDTAKDASHPPVALRVNYSGNPKDLEKGMKLLAFAVKEMDRGVTFSSIKSRKGELRPEFSQQALLQRMLAEYGTEPPAEERKHGR